MLQCADGAFYLGETRDITARLAKHSDGSASSFTARRRPVSLVYLETHVDRPSALKRERQLKGWTRAKKQALIARDLRRLKQL